MGYINISEASKKWGITTRRVQAMCKEGQIAGAERFGRAWMIPEDSPKPRDGRKRADNALSCKFIMPKKSPLLTFTDNTEDSLLFSMQKEYYKGNISAILDNKDELANIDADFYGSIGIAVILAYAAIFEGDSDLFRDSVKMLGNVDIAAPKDMLAKEFWLSVVKKEIDISVTMPDWFKNGVLEILPGDSHSAARISYIKELISLGERTAEGETRIKGVIDLGLIRTLPYFIEPMIAEENRDGAVLGQIYLHLLAAVVYNRIEKRDVAALHADRAIKQAISSGYIMPLAELRAYMQELLDERLAANDTLFARRIAELSNKREEGISILSGAI